MNIKKINSIFKEIMYLDEDENVEKNKSLFSDYGMTSIDYIDFAFELKKHFNIEITPDNLWPINQWSTQETLYSFDKKEWTEVGLSKINELIGEFAKTPISKNIEFKQLYSFFTLEFINKVVESQLIGEK
ncbi:acyl carrier protein [Vibrio spartinae]|uniref:Acyl carrier protein n=1 Tax=Vibrio spartinae TaxID=1918945 RepID=A0A1N6M5N1_9VIBR|nr:acyl carrier protein [Vibrio spartinae]SIO94753.1 Acyl carrier protein [Vibrio spartinae]